MKVVGEGASGIYLYVRAEEGKAWKENTVDNIEELAGLSFRRLGQSLRME